MSENGKTMKYVCPKCGNDSFKMTTRVFEQKQGEDNYLRQQFSKRHICSGCGWVAEPDDINEKQRRISVLLDLAPFQLGAIKTGDRSLLDEYIKKRVDWEGFRFIEVDV